MLNFTAILVFIYEKSRISCLQISFALRSASENDECDYPYGIKWDNPLVKRFLYDYCG